MTAFAKTTILRANEANGRLLKKAFRFGNKGRRLPASIGEIIRSLRDSKERARVGIDDRGFIELRNKINEQQAIQQACLSKGLPSKRHHIRIVPRWYRCDSHTNILLTEEGKQERHPPALRLEFDPMQEQAPDRPLMHISYRAKTSD